MDKFEKILSNKLQNHDAGMDHGAWEQFAERLNNADGFEEALRDKLDNHDAGLDKGAWDKFTQRFEQLQPKTLTWKHYVTGGIAASVIGLGIFYFSSDNSSSVSQNDKQPNVIEQTSSNGLANYTGSNKGTHNTGSTNHLATDNNTEEAVNSNNNTITNNTVNNSVKENSQPNSHHTNNQNIPPVVPINDNKGGNPNTNPNTQTNPTETQPQYTVQLATPEFTTPAFEICQGTPIQLKATNHKVGIDANWMVNGEEVASGSNFSTSFNKPGQYLVQLVYSTSANNKRITSESEKQTIVVLPAPDADFSVNKTNYESIPEYTFTTNNTNAKNYMWSSGDGKQSNEKEMVHVYRKKGLYNATLTVTGQNGCKTTTANKVEVENDYNLLAPNSFTPNGDGRNDVFIPEALKVMNDAQFRMTIYDKSGRKLFETQRVDNAWDGKNTQTGTICGRDAYVWRVELTMPNGTKEEFIGSVTLLD